MVESASTEFYIRAFADHYEALSDSFIDIRRAALSLKRLMPPHCHLFEIGLGTGYFASQFTSEGYLVSGIQPKDEMLNRLRNERPEITVESESTLEDYVFVKQWDAIVSHSSVFLFTTHVSGFGKQGETATTLMFQSFIKGRLAVFHNLSKVMLALSPGGKLYINVQSNPLPHVVVGEQDRPFVFDMVKCNYNLSNEVIEKIFRATFDGRTIEVQDCRFCCDVSTLARGLSSIGGDMKVSDDQQWVVVERNG